MDGSDHDWFEGRGPRCVLMVVIDDATGRVFCRFYESETTAAAFEKSGFRLRALIKSMATSGSFYTAAPPTSPTTEVALK